MIHPGSRWLRIGRASDILPITIPNVIARRKKKESVQPPKPFHGIRRPRPNTVGSKYKVDLAIDADADADANIDADADADVDADADGDAVADAAMDEGNEAAAVEGAPGKSGTTGATTGTGAGAGTSTAMDELDEGTARVAAFRAAFKDRLKTYGVRYQPGASESGANFNRSQLPEKIADHNDSQRISWIMNAPPGKNTFFGHDVRSISFPYIKFQIDIDTFWLIMHGYICFRYFYYPIRSSRNLKSVGHFVEYVSTSAIAHISMLS